jgi:two-component system CheB/CheR fusion protein
MPTLVPMPSYERSHSPMDSKREFVLAEFQHRVKNLMAIIRSIARRTAENASNLEDFTQHFDGRLAALSRTFRILARAGAFDIDLEELVREELLSQTAEERATVNGPTLRLSQNAAWTLGLAIHELAVNAMKYGALANSGGHLAISWAMDEAVLRLEWRESGVSAMDPEPRHHGFGREWIEQGLPYQLRARTSLEFLPGGVVCTIGVPLAQIVGDPA